jgi:hypothetical protein
MAKRQPKQTLKKHKLLLKNEYAALTTKVSTAKRRRAALKATEDAEQKELVRWLREDVGGLFFWHTPNQLAARSGREGSINKSMGVQAGVPDLVVTNPVPGRPEIRGVAIELKVEGRKPSKAQRAVLETLRSHGWLCYVCQGADRAKRVLTAIFGLV